MAVLLVGTKDSSFIPCYYMAISMSASSTTVPHLNTCDVPTMGLRFPPSSRIFRGGCRGVSLSSGPRNASFVVSAKKQTFSNLDDLLAQSDKPVLVDFYAIWHGPCQFMVPVLNKVRVALNDKIQAEKYPSIADKYRIEALPTFILFKDGIPFGRFEGASTANQFIQKIEDSLKVKR